jgi:type VI secretion system secreted protein VgrG
VSISPGPACLSGPDFLEKNATLTVWQGSVPQRYLHGIITGVETGKTTTGR